MVSTIRVQIVRIQIESDNLSDLIWVHLVSKDYYQKRDNQHLPSILFRNEAISLDSNQTLKNMGSLSLQGQTVWIRILFWNEAISLDSDQALKNMGSYHTGSNSLDPDTK